MGHIHLSYLNSKVSLFLFVLRMTLVETNSFRLMKRVLQSSQWILLIPKNEIHQVHLYESEEDNKKFPTFDVPRLC